MGTTVRRYRIVDWLKLILTVGIVFRHAELLSESGRSAAFDVFDRIVMGVTEVCVPLFFMLSGFLYFRNTPSRPDARFFWRKLCGRIRSLLIPYLIANAVAWGVYWMAYRWAPASMNGFLGDGWRDPVFVFWTGPVNLSLWFIRALLVAVLLAPITWLIVRYTRIWGVLAMFFTNHFFGTGQWFNGYFALGAWLALWKSTWVAAADRAVDRLRISPIPVSTQAWCFFIYLYHYLFVLVFKKIFPLWLAPEGFWGLLGVYLSVALLTLALLTGVFFLLKKTLPRLSNVLTGGKG